MNYTNLKKIFLSTIILLSNRAFSMVENKTINTPRGSDVEITIHSSSTTKKPTIIVAPGQSCNSKGPLFETLGVKGSLENFTIVRFEWAYCLKDPSKPIPSDNLANEIEDFKTVMAYAISNPAVDAEKIIIAGKSLGSVVAYSVFQSTPSAKGLVLLTPLCTYTTDDNGNPLPTPLQVCEENYPLMKKDSRPIYMTMGDRDSACIVNVLFDYLKDSQGNVLVNVAGGDHGFRVKKLDGTIDAVKTQRNIDSVIDGILNWVNLKL
jgi:predicted esterase